MTVKPLLATTLLTTLLTAAVAFRRQAPAAPRWEYYVANGVRDTAALNQLGREGWELVAVTRWSMNGNSDGRPGYLYFKRPLP